MVQDEEQNGYLTIEEPFQTHHKEEFLLNIHEDGARWLEEER